MSKDEDFMSLWGKKAGANPQASVIGGLQKQIAERDKEIDKLNQQVTNNKARLAEDMKILEESEKTLNTQASQIQELKNQLYGKGGAPPDKSAESGGAPQDMKSAVAENKQLKKQVKEFQDKIYIFSMLPDRITELEKKNEKLTRMIDQYEANEKKLTDTVKKLSIGAGSEDIVLNLQDQVKKQEDKIKLLQTQLETAKEQAMFPAEAAGSSDTDVRLLKQNIANLTSELNRAKLTGQEEKDRRIELEARVDILKRTIEGAKQTGLQGANVGNLQAEVKTKTVLISELEGKIGKLEAELAENAKSQTGAQDKTKTLEKENKTLRDKVASVEEKYKDTTLRFENLVASKTKGQAGSPVESEMKALRAKVEALSSQNEKLASEKGSLEEQLQSAGAQKGSESLIKDLQGKVTKQKQQIEQLDAENKELREDAASALKDGPAVDVEKIQAENASLKAEMDVMKQAGKGGDAALRSLVADLQTKLSQQKLEVAKLKKENVKLSSYKDAGEKIEFLEKQVAQLKEVAKEKAGGEEVAAPAQSAGPLSTLLTDLQAKLNSAKVIMAKQEADIKKLESKLRDFQTKERIIEDKLGMADTKLASATKKDLEASQKVDELAAFKKKSEDDETIISQLNTQLRDATERVTKAESLVKDRDAELKELEEKVQNLRDALAHK